MSSRPVVDVVLPCLNEVEGLPWVLARIPDGMSAIVVDNGSTDGSAELAASWGALVVRVEQRGYGAACETGDDGKQKRSPQGGLHEPDTQR